MKASINYNADYTKFVDLLNQVSTGSGPCGLLERNENAVTNNATATPIAAPYTAIDASAMSNTRHNCIYHFS